MGQVHEKVVLKYTTTVAGERCVMMNSPTQQRELLATCLDTGIYLYNRLHRLIAYTHISTVYLTTIVTRFFDENDIFILLESSIPALQDGYGIFDVRKL